MLEPHVIVGYFMHVIVGNFSTEDKISLLS